jgi:type I restriction enzyme R subunit
VTLPYTNAEWEKLSIFLTFLVPKLPAPKEEDLSKGILETIDRRLLFCPVAIHI